jgi:hypothetical protein
MDEACQHPTVYWLDQERRIVAIAGPWDSFALDNEGMSACAAQVLGFPLRRFVSGDDARMWLDTLLQLAGLTGQPLERPYRCDSPDLQRFMSMRIVLEDSGLLRLEHRLLRVQRRIRPVRFVSSAGSCPSLRLRCSVCGRVRAHHCWMEPEHCCQGGGSTTEMPVVYTVCPECRV